MEKISMRGYNRREEPKLTFPMDKTSKTRWPLALTNSASRNIEYLVILVTFEDNNESDQYHTDQ